LENIPLVFGSILLPAARSIKTLSGASRHTKKKSENQFEDFSRICIQTYQHVLEIFLDFVMLKSVLDYSENQLKSIHDVNNPFLLNVLHIIESIMMLEYYSK